MPSLYTITNGALAASADINQLVNTLMANQNTPVSVRNTDPITYTLQLENTDAAGKALLIYAPDSTTVLARVQATGMVASPDGSAAAPIVTTTHAQTLTNKTFTSPTLTSPTFTGTVAGGATYSAPHLTSPVIDSGGLTVTAGNVVVTAGALTVTAGNIDLGGTSGVLLLGAGTRAAGGDLRMVNSHVIGWRNAANSADDSLTFDGSDRLVIVGPVVASTATAGGVATTPANNAGYLPIVLNGTAYKIALFLV